MSETGLYRDQYIEFWKRRSEASGYDFGKAPRGTQDRIHTCKRMTNAAEHRQTAITPRGHLCQSSEL